jgi:D-alanyl-D-alanine carboxypeptidase/D-alanyl-D-alanine-endopeptidase (penicillin-binding protein 4)
MLPAHGSFCASALPMILGRTIAGLLAGLALWLISSGPVHAAGSSAAAIAAHLGFTEGEVGFILADAVTGKILEQQFADRQFMPASVTKLPTAYAAVKILGADYRFTTSLFRRGKDLYLRGGGDPVLTANDLQALVLQLQANQTDGKNGRFFYDDTLMAPLPEVSASQPIPTPYNAGFGALNVDFNRVEVVWSRPGGGPPVFQARSIADGLILPCDWITFAPAADALPPGAPFVYAGANAGEVSLDRWQYASLLAPQGNTFLPVRTPSLQTALLFRQLALAAGVALPPPEPGHVPTNAVEIGRVESPPLTEILRGLLRYSNNMEAELIGLAASRKLTGRPLGLGESAAALSLWLERQAIGADWQGFHLENHSGLSPNNRLSPRQMLALLKLIAAEPALMAVLPPREDDGDVADPAPAAKPGARPITGKTGTMDYARGLAGFFPGRDGRPLAFAIFVFDAPRRAALDAAMDRRIADSPPAALSWTRRAKSLDDALLKAWLKKY